MNKVKRDSKTNEAIKEAYKMGYRATKDGKVVSHKGHVLKQRIHKGNGISYYTFGVRVNKIVRSIPTHRFVAYIKFGEKMFLADCVRHLNGNSFDNSFGNIDIGTFSENMQDIPKETRVRTATTASHSYSMKWDDSCVKRIKEFYYNNRSYAQTMKEFGIQSKSTLHFIIHNR